MHCTIPSPNHIDLETPLQLSDAKVLVKLGGIDTWNKIVFTNPGRASTLAIPLERLITANLDASKATGAEISAPTLQRGTSDGGRT
jgi:hypothetical protein